jgi:hypothetical protein
VDNIEDNRSEESPLTCVVVSSAAAVVVVAVEIEAHYWSN